MKVSEVLSGMGKFTPQDREKWLRPLTRMLTKESQRRLSVAKQQCQKAGFDAARFFAKQNQDLRKLVAEEMSAAGVARRTKAGLKPLTQETEVA